MMMSRAVIVGNIDAFWNERTRPIALRASGVRREMSTPSKLTEPSFG